MTFSGVAAVIGAVVAAFWVICWIRCSIAADQLAAVRRHRRKLRRHLDEVNASLEVMTDRKRRRPGL